MATIDVKDATGTTQTVGKYMPGRAAAADSAPSVLSTEDKAALDALGTKLDSLLALVGGTDSQLPAALVGGKLSVTDPSALPLPSGAATQATLADILAKIIAAPATEATLASLLARNPALVNGGVPVTQQTTGTHFQPGFDVAAGVGAGGPLNTDPDGNLVTRAQVLTDELGYRVNFANSSLAVSIGTATFTNGSAAVTGTGFIASDLRTGDYVKLDADAEGAWAQIKSLDSDAGLTLIEPYSGTGGTGASSRSIVKPVTGSGASITVASGQCVIAAGTTAGAISEIERDVDWLPLVKQAGVAVSQRIANQSIYIGSYDEAHPSTPYYFAWFLLDGTTNTTVKCQSARNPSGAPSVSEIEETVVTLPNGATTATVRRWRPEVLGDRVNFFIDGILVATHYRAMPGPGDLLTSTVRVVNGTTPASNTNITIDYDTVKNHNKLEVGLLSDSEQVVAVQAPAQMFPYSVAGVIAINTDLLVIDCSQLRHLSVHCASMGTTGVVTPAWSNDLTNWVTATMMSEAGATSTTFNAAGLRTTNVRARYFRLRLTTATTAGTTTINVAGFQQDLTPPITTQPVSGTVTATVTGGTTLPVTPTQSFVNSAATTNATNTKNAAGTVWSVQVSNINAATRYFKMYNKASAPTVGTDVPVIVIPIPAGTVQTIDGGSNGIRFGTGISWALTAGAADTDTAAVSASEHKVAISYT